MTPTIYAVAWLVLYTGYGGFAFVPMPSMEFCEQTAKLHYFKYKTDPVCIPGQPTQEEK